MLVSDKALTKHQIPSYAVHLLLVLRIYLPGSYIVQPDFFFGTINATLNLSLATLEYFYEAFL